MGVEVEGEGEGAAKGKERKSGVCWGGVRLTGNAAVYHPADHAEQEEEVTHEVAVVSTSCRGERHVA